jgi:exonuclease SbcD
LVIAGDIFDSPNPSAAAEEMFYNFLVDASEAVMGMQIVAIAGNHDSAGRIDAPAQLLHRHNVYVRGTLPRNLKTGEIDYERLIIPLSKRSTTEPEMVCLAVPYLRPSDYPVGMGNGEGLRGLFSALLQEVNKGPHKGLPIISVAHFYAAGSEICENEHSERLVIGGQDCVEADVVGKNVCYTALGHLHKAQKVKSAVREMQYSGSPIPMSFSESHYQHGLSLVEIDAAGNVETQRIVYTPQRPLTTLPARGSALTSEILRMIESLPQRRKNDSGESWPYLELRIEENQPEPTLLYQITTALEDKAVHFCRVVRVYQRENTLSAAHQTTNMLQELSPVEMADLVYKDMYEEPLPEELKQRLIIAEEAALSE